MNNLKGPRRPAYVASLLLLLSLPAAAADTWTARALVDEALAANPGVEALRQSVAAAQWQVAPAGALDDPQLSYAIAPQSIGVSGIDTGHIVGIAQPLPWPGKRSTRSESAKAQVAVVESDLRALQLELAETARHAHAQLRYLHAALKTNVAQQQRLEDLRDAATGRYRASAGSQHAVLRASTRLAERRREALGLAAQRRAVEAQINALRDQPIGKPVPEPAEGQPLPPLPQQAQILAAVQRGNPRLARLQAQMRAAELDQKLAELAYKPDLRLTANYVGTLPRREYRTQVGVMLNVPFGQSKRQASAAASNARFASVQAEQINMHRRLEAMLAEQVAADESTAAMAALYADELLPLARQTLDAAMADYASGRGDVNAVIDAEEALLEAQLGLLSAHAMQRQRRATIARLTGGILNETLLSETSS